MGEATLYVVYASRCHVPLKIRSFIDFLVETVSRVALPRPLERSLPQSDSPRELGNSLARPIDSESLAESTS